MNVTNSVYYNLEQENKKLKIENDKLWEENKTLAVDNAKFHVYVEKLQKEIKELTLMGLNIESKYNRLVKKIEELIRIDFCESLDSEYQNNSNTRQKLQKLLKDIHNE